MNRDKIIGMVCMAMAALLAGICLSSAVVDVERLVGKAVWYLPYVVLVAGVRRWFCGR